MSSSSGSSYSHKHEANSYFADTENLHELARLLHQDRLITRQMGSLFPAGIEPSRLRQVLDIGCGPGGWVLDVAGAYPTLHAIGIDLSPQMVKHARMLAMAEDIPNAEFREMDARKPLAFAASSFDYINARFLYSFLHRDCWPALIQECRRLLKPGGVLRLTEFETSFTTSAAIDRLNHLFALALYGTGHGVSPTGRGVGITCLLRKFLQGAGFAAGEQQAIALDSSAGTETAQGWAENLLVLHHVLLPFMLKTGVATSEEMERLYQQALTDVRSPDFCALLYLLSVWGQAPAAQTPS